MFDPKKRAPVIEVIDDEMAAVLGKKTGGERLKIVDALYDAAWQLAEWNVRLAHPDWSHSRVRSAVAQRIAHATD